MASQYRTAYEEALAKIQSGEDPTGSSMPSYIRSADTLNIANKNKTFVESASEFVDGIPKFIATSMISGANQLYNIPADVGNLLGGDFERSDTYEVISALDSDLGRFYTEHKEGSDLVGFLASSLIPGMAGVKILNAGQASLRGAIGAGKFGANTGKALGLLAPETALHTTAYKTALREATTNSAAANLLSRNALKAIGSGAAQNVLEATAFETAVAVTMFKSPILEDQDFGDFLTNMAFNAGVFGLIGSVVDAAKVSRSLKRAADTAAIQARPWEFIDEAAAASKSYEKVVLDYQQLNDIPKIPTNVTPEFAARLRTSAENKVARLENRVRAELGTLAKGDEVVAETMFDGLRSADINAKQGAMIGLEEATRIASPSAADRLNKLQAKVAKGTATTDEIKEIADIKLVVGYAKMWGEGKGRVTFEAPIITSLVDTLKKGDVIKVTSKGVTAGKKRFLFDTRYNVGPVSKLGLAKPWDATKADVFAAQARYIWASKLPEFKPSATNLIKVHVNDIPLMEKVMLEVPEEKLQFIKFEGLKEGEVLGSSIQNYVGDKKIEIANAMLKSVGAAAKTQDEIAAIVNVRSSLLSGESLLDPTSLYSTADIMALQSYADEYTQLLVKQGSRKAKDGTVDIWDVPQHIKLTYDTEVLKHIGNNHVVENMVIIKEQQKLYQQSVANMVANVLKEDYNKFEDITSGRVFSGAVPSGAGSGLLAAATANYGTLAAAVENIGKTTATVINKFRSRSQDVFEPLLYKLSNDTEAAIEWSVLQQRVRAIEGEYGLNAAGNALEPIQIVRWKKAAKEAQKEGRQPPPAPIVPAHMEISIPLKSSIVRDLSKAHIEVNSQRTIGLAGIRTSQGLQFNRGADVFYPIPVNPTDYPFFALVTDESITSGNHVKTLFANTEEELDGMIKKLKQNPHLRVRTKREAEDYYRSRGQWEYEKTLSSNYLDTEVHRLGISAPFLPSTDPAKIASDTLSWHLQRETGLVREAVSAKYEVQFNELLRLGEEYTNIATSKFGNASISEYADEAVKNPFADYIKTALAIRKDKDYPFLTNLNKIADQALSNVLKRAQVVMERAKTDEELAEINTMLTKAGYKGAAYDESMEIFANATPTKGALSALVQKANSILATIVLRWDVLNAVNNAVSANVLLGSETKAVIRAIERGDAEAVGALAKLMNIKVPGTKHSIKAPTKLVANAIKKFNVLHPEASSDYAFYKENGYITNISDQYRNALEAITFKPEAGVTSWSSALKELHNRLKKAPDTGERWTGNKLAEEFNRFVAADVMKQMTDIAVNRGLMSSKEQLAYINTFVNRTQGNYLAAQRPMLFQGPIGQAIGLFQTYQFNLIQQLLRHVGEGSAKDSMTLLALQGTIHGMNGLPGFNAINTYIVGTASGNTEHKDIFDAVYGIAGKQGGDWLMYGAASNALGLLHPDLKVNLYTRGDINPRHLTVIPTDPSQVAIVQATAKVFGNIFETIEKLGAGGDVTNVLLQGLEHNGISRPLAGLAQTLQGLDNPQAASYATSNQGNVIAANDLLSLANLGRILGGKPLDQAIALDATYRYKAYGLRDAKKRAVLGEAIKSTMLAEQTPTQEQIETFAQKYAEIGGRQEEFAGWMTQLYRTANTSQANKIQQSLNSPFSKSMQRLMGGQELEDFNP